MRLKYQLLLLGLLSLLFPITGWLALKSVDKEFRLNIEQASKNTLLSLKASVQEILQNSDELEFDGFVPIKINEILFDGANTEWKLATAYHYNNQSDEMSIKVAYDSEGLSLFIQSNDATNSSDSLEAGKNDQIIIALADDRGLYKYNFQRQAEGLLLKNNDPTVKPEFNGYWHEKSQGYALEIRFESQVIHHLGVASINKSESTKISTGTLDTIATLKLLPIVSLDKTFQKAINNITPINNHFIIKDLQNRTVYQSDKLPNNQTVSNWQWMITPIYQWLFSIDVSDKNSRWFYRQEDGMAGIKHEIKVNNMTYELKSMMPQGQQSMIQTLLKAGVFMIAVVLLLMLAYLGYSLLLAWRIKNLNHAMQSVLDDSGHLNIKLPSLNADDEIGQLSRGIESMLVEMREYTQYLKDLGSRLSHEMKTPLAVVQSSLDNLEMEQKPEFLERAQVGTKRLRFILNQLSELSQLKYTLEQTPKQKLDLVALIKELSKSYQSFIPNIKTKFHPKALTINGSPELLAQMVDKLMDNARDFISNEGTIEISIEKNKDKVELKVFNTDSQLPDNGLNIFDSLVSIRNQKSNSSIHLGLGLYLVQLIGRYHNAKVKAENSIHPKGVVFTIEFNHVAT